MALVIKGSSSGQVTVDVPAVAGTNTLTLPASTGTVAISNVLHVRDEKTASTSGGASSATTDNVRTLNTVVTNEITGASLGSNRITLPAGTYFIEASAPAFLVNRHRILFYNITDSAVALLGMNKYADSTASAHNTSDLTGRLILGAEKVLELRHYTESARASNGLGVNSDDSRTSIFANVIVTKVA